MWQQERLPARFMTQLLRKTPFPIGSCGSRDDVLRILGRHVLRDDRSINVVITWNNKNPLERTLRYLSKLLYPHPSCRILVRSPFEGHVATDEDCANRSERSNLFGEIAHHTGTDRGIWILLGHQALRRLKVDVGNM